MCPAPAWCPRRPAGPQEAPTECLALCPPRRGTSGTARGDHSPSRPLSLSLKLPLKFILLNANVGEIQAKHWRADEDEGGPDTPPPVLLQAEARPSPPRTRPGFLRKCLAPLSGSPGAWREVAGSTDYPSRINSLARAPPGRLLYLRLVIPVSLCHSPRTGPEAGYALLLF